jgi:hypothetical protein
MMSGELAVAEDLEGVWSVVLVVIVTAERWRNRLESEFRCCIGIGTSLGVRRKISGKGLLTCDVINLLGVEINITKRNTESLLCVGSDFILELIAGKTKCLTFSCRWNV